MPFESTSAQLARTQSHVQHVPRKRVTPIFIFSAIALFFISLQLAAIVWYARKYREDQKDGNDTRRQQQQQQQNAIGGDLATMNIMKDAAYYSLQPPSPLWVEEALVKLASHVSYSPFAAAAFARNDSAPSAGVATATTTPLVVVVVFPLVSKVVILHAAPVSSFSSATLGIACEFNSRIKCTCQVLSDSNNAIVCDLGTSSFALLNHSLLSIVPAKLVLGGDLLTTNAMIQYLHPAQGLLRNQLPSYMPEVSLYDTVYSSENPEGYLARLRAWHFKALNLAVNTQPNFYVSAFPMMHFSDSRYMVRTAMFVGESTLLIPLANTNGAERRYALDLLGKMADRLKNSCQVPGRASCRCTGARQTNYIVCTIGSVSGTAPDWPVVRFAPPPQSTLAPIVIPIETLSVDRPGGFHVCLQGHLYSEKTLAALPIEFLQTFVGYYASLGASDIHLYSNSLESVESTFSRLRSPSQTRIWLHDSAFPRFESKRKLITGVQLKAQVMAVNDCLARTKAMGARWTAVIDLDEFIATEPHGGNLESVLQTQFAKSHVVWMPSYMFNTAHCGVHKTRSVAQAFRFAKLDNATFKGRRKAIYQVGLIDAAWLTLWFPQTHTLAKTAGLMGFTQSEPPDPRRPAPRTSLLGHTCVFCSSNSQVTLAPTPPWPIHIHHYREPWHDSICSQATEEPPAGWVKHVTQQESEDTDTRIEQVY